MLLKGIITPIVILIVLFVGYQLVQQFFGEIPNQNSIQLSQSIFRYPASKSWILSNDRKICSVYINRCTSTAAVITFNSNDRWVNIYEFYRQNFVADGWHTDSFIITSIPTSIVLTSDDYLDNSKCSIIIKEEKGDLLGLLERLDTSTFSIKTTCF